MDDIWLLELMKKKGREDREFSNFMRDRFTEYARGRRGRGMMRHSEYPEYEYDMWKKQYARDYDDNLDMYDDSYINRHSDSEIYDVVNSLSPEDKRKMMKLLSGGEGEHLSQDQARYLVSQMYHTENGRKHIGEKYSYEKAKEISQRYAGMIPPTVTPHDIYVAINAQYHDYSSLFKNWFGDNIDSKIIESAIVFWFKDDDYKEGSKVFNYFMNK